MARKMKKRKLEERDISSDSESECRQKLNKTDMSTVNGVDYESNSDCLFVNENLKSIKTNGKEKSKQSKIIQKDTVKDDAENDGNHTESQSFLAMVVKQNEHNKQATKATKEFLRNFTRNIEDRTKILKDHIRNLIHISVKRENDFLNSFRTAYEISRSPQFYCGSKEGSSFASLQEYSPDLISKSQRILELFETANRIIISAGIENVEKNLQWNEEINETEDLLRLGRQVGIERYNAMIQGDRMIMERNNLTKKKSSPSNPAIFDCILYDSDKRLFQDGVSWGVIAQKQLRALKKLVKVTNSASPSADI
ncbi:hypothetical protein EV44_g1311 [Erysiphe necator]|uniref:Uncharacterized protein n=1 Tax=Uncinula necator TaxID=52586 RepID=A0A0B1P7W9_UNCNE|nr:hypothetical protein EV44_g1311 [Erysiphe necator]